MIYTIYSSQIKIEEKLILDFDTFYKSSIEIILSNDFGANNIKDFFKNITERNSWDQFYNKLLIEDNIFIKLAYQSKHQYCFGWFIANLIIHQHQEFFNFLEKNNANSMFFDLFTDINIFNKILKILGIKIGISDNYNNFTLISPIDIFINSLTDNQIKIMKEIGLQNKTINIIQNNYIRFKTQKVQTFAQLQYLQQEIDMITNFSKIIDLKNINYNSILNNLNETFTLMSDQIKKDTDKLFIQQNYEIIAESKEKTNKEIELVHQNSDTKYKLLYSNIYIENFQKFEPNLTQSIEQLVNIFNNYKNK